MFRVGWRTPVTELGSWPTPRIIALPHGTREGTQGSMPYSSIPMSSPHSSTWNWYQPSWPMQIQLEPIPFGSSRTGLYHGTRQPSGRYNLRAIEAPPRKPNTSGPRYSDKPDEMDRPASFPPEPSPVPTTSTPLSTDGTREQPGPEDVRRQYEEATLDFLDREIHRLCVEIEIMEIQEKVREHAAALLILNQRWAELLHGRGQS